MRPTYRAVVNDADSLKGARIWLLLACLMCFSSPLLAQLSNSKCKTIPAGRLQIQLDSLSVNPESIRVPDAVPFSYDLATGEITFEAPLAAAIEICYQVYPFALHEPVYKYDMSLYSPEGRRSQEEVNKEDEKAPLVKEELFATESLYKTGSISRGITVGNTNNLGVTSSLNLQLDGQLADDLYINAVITDQQVPFQPEGNTQQIQDFDKVLVNLYNDRFSLMAGDVVLRNDSTYFLKYYKNVQGGRAAYNYGVGNWKASTSVTASIAKGKFSSALLEAVEGLSGPYRLRGPDGERFIIVIANSEKIFLDGRLLKRGFNEDYVIDYNLAEITFTPRVLITKFSRIRVDFEYTSQSFSRSILSASHRQSNGKTSAYFEVYREKDNPFKALTFDLTEADRQVLSSIGDDLSQAVIPGADSVGYTANRILYAKTDTVDSQGKPYSIFKYSTDPQRAVYQVSFSQVAAGDYRQLPLGLNGKVYEWVAPVNGVSQGGYSPNTPIVTPNSRQLMVGGMSTKLGRFETVFTELAASNQDKNLFSPLDQADNQGWAQKSGIRSEGRDVGFLTNYKWASELSYEWNHRYFRPIDRYRYIEYDRDWSYTPIFQSASEPAPIEDHIVVGRLGMTKNAANRWNYQASYRNKGDLIDGWQQKAVLRQQIGKATVNGDLFDLKSAQGQNESTWTRTQLTGSYKLGSLVPGYTFQSDRNTITNLPADSVVSTAMNYSQHMVFVQSADSAQNGTTFRLDANRRVDDRPVDGVLERSDVSYTSNASFSTQWKDRHSLSGTFTYRQLDDLLDGNSEKEETVQGRINWQSAWWERSVRSDLSLALLNGRELRREYVFVEVIPGQGTHTWRDDNGDGVQDLNEFYEAINPDERTYAKIFVPTDTYISAYQTILNYSLELTAPTDWKSSGGFKSFLGRFSNVSAVLVDRKTQDSNWARRFDVWSTPGVSADELAYKNAIRSRWFFNRADPKYGLDIGYQSTAGRQLLTGGWEARNKKVWQLNSRTNLSADWAILLQSEVGDTESSSDIFANRNYQIRQRQVKPQLQWMPRQWLRITSSVRYSHKRAVPIAEEQGSDLTEYQVDWQVNKSLQSTISGFVKLIDMNFKGDEASPLGYEMLEALRPGTNYTWRLQWQQRLKNGLRLQVNYDGRKSPQKAVIHFGGVQVTALF